METGEKIELSVIMPCLNEESTVGYCVDEALQFSYDMVIGNRYEGGMERRAMPLTHRWGVCLLSFLGRRRYHVDVFDFHCGLRGISAQAVKKLDFRTDGMEFATEMIAEAARRKLRIKQVPVALRKCDYKRKSKLRTVRDGIRHLRYIYTGKKISCK